MFKWGGVVYAASTLVGDGGGSGDSIIPSYSGTGFKFAGKTIGDILGGEGGILAYIYVFAGLILLLLLISGGFSLMTSAGNQDKIKSGYGKITSAIIGFLIIFVSYVVAQTVERIFGVSILGG